MEENFLLLKLKSQDYGSPDDFKITLRMFNEANKPIVEVEEVSSLCEYCLNEECQEVLKRTFEGTKAHLYVEECEFATVKP